MTCAFVNTSYFHIFLALSKLQKTRGVSIIRLGIFGEVRNKLQSGYALREVINKVDELKFLSNEDKHELSSLYEDKIKNMGNAGRNGGEYYTPRPLIKSIIKVVNPQIGEIVYDPAVGSAGFLSEAYSFMRNQRELSASELEQLQNNTFIGKEKKSLAYVIWNYEYDPSWNRGPQYYSH